ncbi:hypothetical protein AVEN_59155-1 [Araneus ventricosus]|uniref:Adenylate kinase n=1 Tax=Araneus ventricosus TaxID=182803 RepID=A0A4Y2PBU6_ARAVE|nr:hypothetical protein AVEN_59155-1 [Araneus ventricosus]
MVTHITKSLPFGVIMPTLPPRMITPPRHTFLFLPFTKGFTFWCYLLLMHGYLNLCLFTWSMTEPHVSHIASEIGTACIERCLKRGAEGSGRSDDNIESLKKRFRTFHEDTLPIVNQFSEKGMVLKVDGGQDPDTVFQKIRELFEKHS